MTKTTSRLVADGLKTALCVDFAMYVGFSTGGSFQIRRETISQIKVTLSDKANLGRRLSPTKKANGFLVVC
jgi:hypothetical protein